MKTMEFQCTVQSNKMLTPTVFELAFTTDKPLIFKAGQFISVVIPGAGPKGRDLRRAYSIASPPEKNPVELCIKIVEDGPGTQFLYSLKKGDTFKGVAPYGDFVYRGKPGRHACFIATGTGLAPFRAMITSADFAAQPPASVTCLLGVRSDSELLYVDELGQKPEVNFVKAVSAPSAQWNGFKGRVTDYLRGLGSSFPWKETDYYLCGNGAMITEVKTLLQEKGVEKDSIHQEKYY